MSLSCCKSLASKPVLVNFSRLPALISSVNNAHSAAAPKMTVKKYEPPKIEDHEARNTRLSRPLSPHLSILFENMPFTSFMSLTHRATGIALSAYVSALGISALVAPHDVSHYITMVEGLHMSPAVLLLAKSIIAVPFAFHLANGFRHLYWDMAKGLSIKEVYTSGYTVLGLTVLLTIGLAML